MRLAEGCQRAAFKVFFGGSWPAKNEHLHHPEKLLAEEDDEDGAA
jgi:hypothetical protein